MALSLCMMLSVFLAQVESVRSVTPLCALHYRAFQKQLLRAKASARRPKQVIHLSSETIASLAWWVSPAGFAANTSAPIRELDPTVEIWTDANLERGGDIVLTVTLFKDPGLVVIWHIMQA